MTEESTEELKLLRAKISKKRNSFHTMLGMGIPPSLLYATWANTHDPELFRQVSGWLFALLFVIWGTGQNRLAVHGKKIAHLRHQYKVVYPGLFGTPPEEKIYDVKYEFDRFTEADCRTYQKMQRSFDILAFGLCGIFGHGFYWIFLETLFGIKL